MSPANLPSVMNHLLALILGGGAGTRLRPLTQYRSKPAVPLLGKYRLIDVPISNCLHVGIDRIFVLTQFNAASLNQYIATTYHFDDFSNRSVSVLAAEQTPSSSTWYQGTADAVRQSIHHLRQYTHSHVLVLSGDHVYQMDYAEMMRHHLQYDAQITLATTAVGLEEAPRFGIVETDAAYRVRRFREKPRLSELAPQVDGHNDPALARLQASTGIYLFDREVLERLLLDHPEYTDFGHEVIPYALNRHRVVSYPFEGFWMDIGGIGAYHEAHMLLAGGTTSFDLHGGAFRLFSRLVSRPPARIVQSTINDAVITDGCLIDRCEIERAVIGPSTVIGARSVIREAIIMGTSDDLQPGDRRKPARIGERCIIERAILDVNVRVGEGSIICNDEGIQEATGEDYVIRDGIVVIPEHTELPPGTVIGATRRPALPKPKRVDAAPHPAASHPIQVPNKLPVN